MTWFNIADKDESGHISMQEFFFWTLKAMAKKTGAGLADIFKG
jgi:hypothetical protein